MSEVNERDLEQVAGGKGSGFSSVEWENRNCNICEKHGRCNVVYVKALQYAMRAAAEGKDFTCPNLVMRQS